MLNKTHLAAAILAVSICGACSDSPRLDILNFAIPAIGYEKQADVAYGDLVRQTMDTYYPTKPAENSQIVFFVYGGAWRTGDRQQYEFVGQALSSAGHTVVIPDYRLYPQTTFPGFVDDIVAAIEKWTELHKERIEPNPTGDDSPLNIVLMGHSSGAHSAALLASDPSWLETANVTVTELIGLSGPYDLPVDDDEVAPVFPNVPPNSVKANKLATPCHPRTLLLHGTSDKRVLPRHSETYNAALIALNVEVELVLLEGADHAKPIAALAAPLQFTGDSLEIVVQFLSESDNTLDCESVLKK